MAMPPVVARLVADASGYVEGMSKSVAATRDWQLEMDKADLASRKMAVTAESASQKAAAAQAKLATASTDAAAAQRELIATQEQLAAGEISATDAAEREAAAQTQLAAANDRAAAASIQLERASITQAEAQVRTAAAAREAAVTTSSSATTAAATATRANSTAAAAGAGAWSRYSGIAKLAVAAIGYESVKSAGEFQKSTNVYVTAAGETESGLKKVRQGILDIASGTGTPIKELTDGMYLVEKAGYRGADALKVERAAAQGAKEENASLATVTNAVTSVMASYHLGAGDAVMVTNELKTAAGESKTTMEEYSGALSTVIPIASQLGISFADVGGAMATMTQHGTSAKEASQQLAFTIRSLSGGNAVASKEMAQLGISSADVSAQMGKRGLAGTIDYIVTTIGSKLGPSGQLMLNTFNQSKQAAADAETMFGRLSPAAQALATQFEHGAISSFAFKKATHDLGGEMGPLATQWLTTYTNANGFQQALRNGTPVAQSYSQALQKVFGGVNGMDTALMVARDNMPGYQERVQRIADAAKDAGTNVQGWESTQKLFNTQMDRTKETVGVLGIKLGTDLLPVVTSVAHGFLDLLGFVEHNSTAFKVGAIAVAAFVVPMYAATKAVAAYQAVVRGVAAVQAIWAGAAALYGRVAASMGLVTGGAVEMQATQAAVAAETEALAASMGGLVAAEGEVAVSTEAAITSFTGLSVAEARAGSVAVVTGGEINTLAASEARAMGTTGALTGEMGALGAAEAEAGAGADVAAGGLGRMGAGAGAAAAKMGGLAAGILLVVGNSKDLATGQHAGTVAAQQQLAVLNQQHNSLQGTSAAYGQLHDKMDSLRGPGSYMSGLVHMLSGGIFGNSALKSISDANKIGDQLQKTKVQIQNMKSAEDTLSRAFGITTGDVEVLANKYGIDLGGATTETIAKFERLAGQMGITTVTTANTTDHLGGLIHNLQVANATDVAPTIALVGYLDTMDKITNLINRMGQIPSAVWADPNVQRHYYSKGPAATFYADGGIRMAAGGVLSFATGSENHVAQIATAGSNRLWAEPETGGEAYIPLAMAKRGRSLEILAEVMKRFGITAAEALKMLGGPKAMAAFATGGATRGGDGASVAGVASAVAGAGQLGSGGDLVAKTQDLTRHLVEQTTALKNHKATVTDGHTQLLAYTDAVKAHSTALTVQTQTTNVARVAVDTLIPRVVAGSNAHTADHHTVDGLTVGYRTLTGAIQQTPTAHHTNTDAPGAVTSTDQIRTLEATIRAMQPKTDRINIDTTVSGVFASLFAQGGLVGYAGGGILRGPGTGTSDSILGIDGFGMPTARVSDGEFVVNERMTSAYLPLLQAINAGQFANGGLIRKLAAGGTVATRVSDPTGTNAGSFTSGAASLVNRVDAMLNPKAHSLIEHRAADEVKKKIAAMTAGVGGGVARWTPLVLAAMGMLGISPSLLPVVMSQMNTESGGNPAAINLTDSNAAAGHPSQGLMQVIPGTFAAYAGPFAGRGILDPLANIYAGLNYARSRYGAGLSALGHGHGYAAGGLVNASRDMRLMGFSSVRQAQEAMGVTVDGILGPQTYAALEADVRDQDRSVIPASLRPLWQAAGLLGGSTNSGGLYGGLSQSTWAGIRAALAMRAKPTGLAAASPGLRKMLGVFHQNELNLTGGDRWASQLGTFSHLGKGNAWVYDQWAAQTSASAKDYAAKLKAYQPTYQAHRGQAGYESLERVMQGEAAHAAAQAATAAQMVSQARARLGGPEWAAPVSAGPTSRGMSWAALHAPVAAAPQPVVVHTNLHLDGKKIAEVVQTHVLQKERRNVSNGLSAKSR